MVTMSVKVGIRVETLYIYCGLLLFWMAVFVMVVCVTPFRVAFSVVRVVALYCDFLGTASVCVGSLPDEADGGREGLN